MDYRASFHRKPSRRLSRSAAPQALQPGEVFTIGNRTYRVERKPLYVHIDEAEAKVGVELTTSEKSRIARQLETITAALIAAARCPA
jgi:hypothetical protein